MSNLVVDASVAIKWVVEEHHTEDALKVLNPSIHIHAPELLHIETDTYLTRQIKLGNLPDTEAEAYRSLIRSAPMRVHPYSSTADSAFGIASLLQHSIYDSIYLAVAVIMDGQMVTADRRFFDLAAPAFSEHLTWITEV